MDVAFLPPDGADVIVTRQEPGQDKSTWRGVLVRSTPDSIVLRTSQSEGYVALTEHTRVEPACSLCGGPFAAQEARAGWDTCEHCDRSDPEGSGPAIEQEVRYPAWTERDPFTGEVPE